MKGPSPFALPSYRVLWFANLACNVAVLIQSIGASWSLVEQGASPQTVALVQTALSLPLILISPLSGAICDAMDRRKVMVFAQLLLGIVALILVSLAHTGVSSAIGVLACMFLAGCSLAFNGPAFMASIADAVPRKILPDAVLANAVGLNLARSIGPAIGGALLAAAGIATTYLVAACIALGLVLLLARWRPERQATADDTADPEPLIGAIWAGFRFAMATPQIKAALLRAALFTFAFSMVQALMPLVASDLLEGGPELYGILFGCFGVGALVGALSGSRIRRAISDEFLVRLCIVLLCLGGPAIALSTNIVLTAFVVAISGASWVVALAIFNTTIQLASPRRIGGRTLSIYQMAVFTGIASGSWLSGLVADIGSVETAFLAMGGAGLLTLLAGLALPIRQEIST